jgi:uncharacterized repeat protein (TIGR01451 family)
MNTRGRFLSVTISLAICAGTLLGSTAPRLTSRVYGTLDIAGDPVPEGTPVEAWLGGQPFASTTTVTVHGQATYHLDVPGDRDDTPEIEVAVEGQPILFKVGQVEISQTVPWHRGDYQRLDLTVPAGTDLALTLSDDRDVVEAGEQLTFALRVTNTGTLDATGVLLTHTLPSHTLLVTASDDASSSEGTVTWPPFDLDAGSSTVRTLTVELAPTFPADVASLTHTATVRDDGSRGLDPDLSNNTATDVDVVDAAPDLVLTQHADRTAVAPGEILVYTLTVTNTGTRDAVNVGLEDQLSPEVLFQTATDDGIAISSETVRWPSFDLAAGASVDRGLRVLLPTDSDADQLTNTATVVPGNGPDRADSDNTATLTTTVLKRSTWHPPLWTRRAPSSIPRL